MSQVTVKWVHKETPARFYTGNPRPSGLGTTEEQFVPVVELSALREVVEGLQKLVNEARGFEAMANDQSHGYTNRRILRERIDEAQRLLASLGEQ